MIRLGRLKVNELPCCLLFSNKPLDIREMWMSVRHAEYVAVCDQYQQFRNHLGILESDKLSSKNGNGNISMHTIHVARELHEMLYVLLKGLSELMRFEGQQTVCDKSDRAQLA